MTERIGKRKAQEHDWGRRYHDGTVRNGVSLKVVPVRKRFWWPHPYARQATAKKSRPIGQGNATSE